MMILGWIWLMGVILGWWYSFENGWAWNGTEFVLTVVQLVVLGRFHHPSLLQDLKKLLCVTFDLSTETVE